MRAGTSLYSIADMDSWSYVGDMGRRNGCFSMISPSSQATQRRGGMLSILGDGSPSSSSSEDLTQLSQRKAHQHSKRSKATNNQSHHSRRHISPANLRGSGTGRPLAILRVLEGPMTGMESCTLSENGETNHGTLHTTNSYGELSSSVEGESASSPDMATEDGSLDITPSASMFTLADGDHLDPIRPVDDGDCMLDAQQQLDLQVPRALAQVLPPGYVTSPWCSEQDKAALFASPRLARLHSAWQYMTLLLRRKQRAPPGLDPPPAAPSGSRGDFSCQSFTKLVWTLAVIAVIVFAGPAMLAVMAMSMVALSVATAFLFGLGMCCAASLTVVCAIACVFAWALTTVLCALSTLRQHWPFLPSHSPSSSDGEPSAPTPLYIRGLHILAAAA